MLPSKLKPISYSLSQLLFIFWKNCLWDLPDEKLQKAMLAQENKGMKFASQLSKKDSGSIKYLEIKVDVKFL